MSTNQNPKPFRTTAIPNLFSQTSKDSLPHLTQTLTQNLTRNLTQTLTQTLTRTLTLTLTLLLTLTLKLKPTFAQETAPSDAPTSTFPLPIPTILTAPVSLPSVLTAPVALPSIFPFPPGANLPRFPPPPGAPAASPPSPSLLPGAPGPALTVTGSNVTAILANNGEYSALLSLLQEYDLVNTINDSPSPKTLLAPSNSAFNSIPESELSLLRETGRLGFVLRYHILVGYYNFSQLSGLQNGTVLATYAGISVPLSVADGGSVQIGAVDPALASAVADVSNGTLMTSAGRVAKVDGPDVSTDGSGILSVQGINAVLLPPGALSPAPAPSPAQDSISTVGSDATPADASNGNYGTSGTSKNGVLCIFLSVFIVSVSVFINFV